MDDFQPSGNGIARIGRFGVEQVQVEAAHGPIAAKLVVQVGARNVHILLTPSAARDVAILLAEQADAHERRAGVVPA